VFDIFGQDFIFRLIAIVVGLVVHEFAHAWTASLFGDKTAKLAGRVTLNPVAHLDPIGLLMIVFAPFGWAKPVPVNPLNFRRPRLGMVVVALAGPLSNLLLAVLVVLFSKLYFSAYPDADLLTGFVPNLLRMSFLVNVALFVFNLIPIFPLDGSRIVSGLLPYRWEVRYRKLELYGPFILLMLVIIPQTNQAIFGPLINGVAGLIIRVLGT
jgi:Zn-dependent protease